MIAFWSHSCGWGPMWLFLTLNISHWNGGSGIEIDFRHQKIARQRYSPRQYLAIGEVCCFRYTHSRTDHKWPDMGLSIMHSKTIWTYYGVWAQFRFLRMFAEAQWAWGHTPYNYYNVLMGKCIIILSDVTLKK